MTNLPADLILHIYIFSRHGATLTFIWSRPTSKWKSLFLFCFLVLRKTFGSLATKCSAVFSGWSPCLPVSRWCSVQWLCWCKVVVHPIKLSKPLTVYKDGTSWSPLVVGGIAQRRQWAKWKIQTQSLNIVLIKFEWSVFETLWFLLIVWLAARLAAV